MLHLNKLYANLNCIKSHPYPHALIFMQRECKFTLGRGATAEHLENYI